MPQEEEIEVTKDMIEVGMEELFQHRIGEDWPYVLEKVYRAMLSASDTSASK